jgi:1-acyl-sn-glycerol-3-phosphate acyltransferase
LSVARVLGRLWLGLFGWTLEPPPAVIPPKFVVIAAPHTSAWDLPFMLATACALGIPISWFGKQITGDGVPALDRWCRRRVTCAGTWRSCARFTATSGANIASERACRV